MNNYNLQRLFILLQNLDITPNKLILDNSLSSDLGFQKKDFACLHTLIQNEFCVQLKLSEIEKCHTIYDVFQIINELDTYPKTG